MVPISDASALAEERRDSRVGFVLADRYRVHALLDKGAMGRVYVGEHVLMKKRVAIKVLHRELTTVPEFVLRFEREATAAANIDNEHVVAATDFGKLPDGAVFLVLEFIEGKNLRDEIVEGPIPVPRALHIARQMAEALRSAHALSIVHRDLKPENVMLVEKAGDPDFVKVLDFGIAKVPIAEARDEEPTSRPITKAGMVFGTPEYMPPEQALGQAVDHRADIYSLGVILFEMLAGVRPFVGTSQVGVLGQQIARGAPSVSSRAPGVFVPPAVERLVAHLLGREPSERPQSANAVIEAIDAHLGYAPGRSRIPTLIEGTYVGAADTAPAPPNERTSGEDLPTLFRSARPSQHPLAKLGRSTDRFKARLPAPFRTLPAPVILSVPMALISVVLGFGVVSALESKHEPPPAAKAVRAEAVTAPAPAPVPRASPEELEVAARGGPKELAALGQRYPRDPAIPLAEAAAFLRGKQPTEAVSAIAEAISLDPELKSDTQVASALWVTAQNKKSSAAAFELLKGPMGERGRAILRDLSTTPQVKSAVRKSAEAALAELEGRPAAIR